MSITSSGTPRNRRRTSPPPASAEKLGERSSGINDAGAWIRRCRGLDTPLGDPETDQGQQDRQGGGDREHPPLPGGSSAVQRLAAELQQEGKRERRTEQQQAWSVLEGPQPEGW